MWVFAIGLLKWFDLLIAGIEFSAINSECLESPDRSLATSFTAWHRRTDKTEGVQRPCLKWLKSLNLSPLKRADNIFCD